MKLKILNFFFLFIFPFTGFFCDYVDWLIYSKDNITYSYFFEASKADISIAFMQSISMPTSGPSEIFAIQMAIKSKQDLQIYSNSFIIIDSLQREYLPNDYYAMEEEIKEFPIGLHKNDSLQVEIVFNPRGDNKIISVPAVLKCFFVTTEGDTVKFDNIYIKSDDPPYSKSKPS